MKPMRELVFDLNAIEDILWWLETDKRIAGKVLQMIIFIEKDPSTCIGKPEPLKYDLFGCWSRRINVEHRIVYQVTDTKIRILQCRYHY